MTRGILTAVSIFLAAMTTQANGLTVEQRLSDFEQLNAIIDSGYGPLEYKTKQIKIDIAQLRRDFEEKIRAAKTNGDFYYLLTEYVASYRDGHFGAMVPSYRVAIFPVMVERVQGRVIIDQVMSGFPRNLFPFRRGDEVIEFNGKPVQEEIENIARYIGHGNRDSQLRVATWFLFYRPGTQVPIPQEPTFTVTVRRANSDEPQTVTGTWLVQGELLDEHEEPQMNFSSHEDIQPISQWGKLDYFKFSTKEYWDEFHRNRQKAYNVPIEANYSCNGGTRIRIPRDAVIISEQPFVAYYHKTPYGNVGYLRVPHYSPQHRDGSPAIEEWFAMYEYAVYQLEKNTVGLVIDQDHNCGGYVSFANQFVGLFMDKPYKPMQFSLLANKGEYLKFSSWVNSIPLNTLMREEMNSVARLIHTSWRQGLALTSPISIDGKALMYPHDIRYTKPIVMLIDEMAGSGGDAVPAMLQGYGRVKLIGNQTASMGGHVELQPALNYSRVQVRMTKSLFYRPDGTPIENNGAVPDFPYRPTYNDFMNGYQEYQAYYLKVLGELVTAVRDDQEEAEPNAEPPALTPVAHIVPPGYELAD